MKKQILVLVALLLFAAPTFAFTDPVQKKIERFEQLQDKVRNSVTAEEIELAKALDFTIKVNVAEVLTASELQEFMILFIEFNEECCSTWRGVDEEGGNPTGMCERWCWTTQGPFPRYETAECCNLPPVVEPQCG